LWCGTGRAKVSDLVQEGAVSAETPAQAAGQAEVVLTMVADPAALQSVTEGPAGLAAGVERSTTVIEMSTVGPGAIRRLASTLPPGTPLLDAPVLGSVAEAESGSLEVFVGGPAELYEQWGPLLSALGSPMHVGPLGAGAAAKLVANATLFGVLGALGEALALAEGLGLSQETAFHVLDATPLAAQARRRRSSIESGRFPPRFRLALARKDVELILEAAAAGGVDLRLIDAMRSWLEEAERSGLGDSDYSAVLAHIMGNPSV
jgi:3-hydroxyisobutyrate dehydrogenase